MTEREEIAALRKLVGEQGRRLSMLERIFLGDRAAIGTGNGDPVRLHFRIIGGPPDSVSVPYIAYVGPDPEDIAAPRGFVIAEDGETEVSILPPIQGLLAVGGSSAGTDTRPGNIFELQDSDGNVYSASWYKVFLNGVLQERDEDYQPSADGTQFTVTPPDGASEVQDTDRIWIEDAYGRRVYTL